MKVEVDGTKAASIIQVLQELAGGDFAFDASKRLQKVVEAVKLYKGKGKLIMELKISPLPKFGEVAVNVEPKLKLELPDKSYKNSIRFIGKDDVLQTTDPAQQDFSNLEKSFSKPQN